MMPDGKKLKNYVDGQWRLSGARTYFDVENPATGELLARVPDTPADEVAAACEAAARAFPAWRRTPVTERIQPLFTFKRLLEEHLGELARIITEECGKTLRESEGELRRGIENVEVACGMPMMMQGTNLEDIASGIDEHMIRQPVGVVTAITPFNFPGMIPLWFLPYAIAAGNCFILKPSERVPLTAQRLVELLEEAGLPPGVLQLVHGGRETSTALIEHPVVQAVSFVGSSAAARAVYARAGALGKRVQCQGGAKNTVVVLPDADLEMTTKIVADSAFGCAGQRCLANSLAITVGAARGPFTEAIAEAASARRVGRGAEEGIEMGPVITAESQARIEAMVERAEAEGARILVEGRRRPVEGLERGHWVRPTVLDELTPESEIARTEVFGPVFGLLHVETVDEAIALVNAQSYGNMACLFTSSGEAARRFRYEVQAGNVGINIGVAAPMAFFPFSGWKGSFFGDLHAQGHHAVEFYTQTKVIVERWPSTWSRRF